MISFFVGGVPKPKGSAKAFAYMKDGKPRANVTNACDTAKDWQAKVNREAKARFRLLKQEPFEVPEVVLLFVFARAKSHYNAKGEVKPRALKQPPTDIDKLTRTALDALTGVAYADDKQVKCVTAAKCWANDLPGVNADLSGVVIDVADYKMDYDGEALNLLRSRTGTADGSLVETWRADPYCVAYVNVL